ncbi:hypothetical protein [Goodfellowiella coeruleoviolacea]|uniref:Uncharacterized protein n=1 Tax=Goodfellowiella coeruleoviolacea TaxID=334858 RepID=A0AAE3GKH9_9PSEU|nr:hypothetical protein [Goodfellowiella coeruleoviolacea]MCP2169137.1 hypothetical protein [Goodfellowiella coeruleoviolacea]
MRGIGAVLAVLAASAVVLAGALPATAQRHDPVHPAVSVDQQALADNSIITTTPKALIAMTGLRVDTGARTFEFNTAERFGDPLEHVVAHWVGTQERFQYAVDSIARRPSLFHVFRLYRDDTGRVVSDDYFYTAG